MIKILLTHKKAKHRRGGTRRATAGEYYLLRMQEGGRGERRERGEEGVGVREQVKKTHILFVQREVMFHFLE